MFIDNLDKIIWYSRFDVGYRISCYIHFIISIAYFRSPVVAGVIGNMSSRGMRLGVIFEFVTKEMRIKTKPYI